MNMQRKQLSDQEKIDWLRLIRTENIGPITFYELIRKFGSANDILRRLPMLVKNGGKKDSIFIPSEAAAAKEIEQLEKFGGQFIFAAEANYPHNLSFLEDAPPVIASIGNLDLLSQSSVSIVGARNSSMNGEKLATNMAQRLGKDGFVITSGLARGIDRHAHIGGLETGTIGVVAGGINVLYPPENKDIYERMKSEGLILAEMPFGTEPIARLFPKRNRIVSGISRGILVVEATLKSGSLITARMALEQGREVFAVPGSPFDPRCKGTNHLIKEGANLVEKVEDILAVLEETKQVAFLDESESSYDAGPVAELDETDVASARDAILEHIGPTPIDLNELVNRLEQSKPFILTALLELELAGQIIREPGGKIYAMSNEMVA